MAYGWISINGVRFSTNLGGRIDLISLSFCGDLFGLSRLYGKMLAARCRSWGEEGKGDTYLVIGMSRRFT